MNFERRDLWWAIGMAIVCVLLLNKRGWSESGPAVLRGLVGAGLGIVISRMTRKARSG